MISLGIHGTIIVIGDGVNILHAVGKLRRLFGHAFLLSVKEEIRKTDESGQEDESGPIPYKFPVGLLNHITNNFSEDGIIGRGRHGVVYKVLH